MIIGVALFILAVFFALINLLAKGGGGIGVPQEIKKEEGQKSEEFVGKLKEMIARGIPMKCTYKGKNITGTGFVKGKKYYGEISHQGKEGFIIIKDNCMWNWSKNEAKGVKMCFKQDIFEMDNSSSTQAQAATEGEYVCRPDIVSDDKFNPPSNISFVDLDKEMPDIEGD